MSATAADIKDAPGTVKSLLVVGQPPTDGTPLHVEIEAERDVKIVGWATGDTPSTSKTVHQWIRSWLGGTDPQSSVEGEVGNDGIAFIDDSDYLFEFDMTQNDDTTNGIGYADNDGATTFLPADYHFPWNEGVTLNVKMFNGNNPNNDAMEVIIYYIPGGDGSVLD